MKWAALLLLVCSCGPRFYDCPVGVEDDMAMAAAIYPSEIAGRMDVLCKPEPYAPDVECVTWWFGSSVARGRMEAWDRFASECIMHEAQHWHLFEQGDECAEHAEECGWVWLDQS